MKSKYFIDVRNKDNARTNSIRLVASHHFSGPEYSTLLGLINWNRAWYYECLYHLLRLHPNGPEYDAQFNPLHIIANSQKTTILHEVLDTTVSLATTDFIQIVEDSLLFRHYVRKGEGAKELIRLAVHQLINEQAKTAIAFNQLHTIPVVHEQFEVDIRIVLTEKDYDLGVDNFMERIVFDSDLK